MWLGRLTPLNESHAIYPPLHSDLFPMFRSSAPGCRYEKEPFCNSRICVFVCECVFGRSRVYQPLNLWLCLSSTQAFSLRLVPSRLAAGVSQGSTSALPGSSASLVPPLTPPDGPIFLAFLTYPPHLGFQYLHLI